MPRVYSRPAQPVFPLSAPAAPSRAVPPAIRAHLSSRDRGLVANNSADGRTMTLRGKATRDITNFPTVSIRFGRWAPMVLTRPGETPREVAPALRKVLPDGYGLRIKDLPHGVRLQVFRKADAPVRTQRSGAADSFAVSGR